jgi:hypothetical protein
MRNYFLWVIPTMKYYCDKVVILPVSFGQNLPSLSNWFDESGRFSSSSPSTYPNVCWQLHVRCYPPLIWTICSKSRRFFSHVVPSSYKFACNSHINHKPQLYWIQRYNGAPAWIGQRAQKRQVLSEIPIDFGPSVSSCRILSDPVEWKGNLPGSSVSNLAKRI